MALRGCWRLAGLVPRISWRCAVQTGASNPGGRGSVSGFGVAYPGWKNTELLLCRTFSSAPPNNEVNYEELKQLMAARKAVVIDVREPWELREFGFIPSAINVPLAQVNSALKLDPEEFKEKYGGEMPEQTDTIVFSCLAGIRSKTAVQSAESLGYKNVQHYIGGWKDWEKNERIM